MKCTEIYHESGSASASDRDRQAEGLAKTRDRPPQLANATLWAVGTYLAQRGLAYHVDRQPTQQAGALYASTLMLAASVNKIGLMIFSRDRRGESMPRAPEAVQNARNIASAGGDYADGARPTLVTFFEGEDQTGRPLEGAFSSEVRIDYLAEDGRFNAARVAECQRFIEGGPFAARLLGRHIAEALEALEPSYSADAFVLIRRWYEEAAARLGFESLDGFEDESILPVSS